MIPTSFTGWRRLRQKRALPVIPPRFEEFCEEESDELPIGSFLQARQRHILTFTCYPHLQKHFLKDFDADDILARICHYKWQTSTNSVHIIYRNLVPDSQLDDAWFQANDEYIQTLSLRQKMALVAMTNKSHQHVQALIVHGDISSEFVQRVKNWRDDVHGFLPIFFPLLDRHPDESLSLKKNYKRIVQHICPALTKKDVRECVQALADEVRQIFARASRTTHDMVLVRGLKHQPRTKWTTQGFTAMSLNPFQALNYTDGCIQTIRILPRTPLLFLGGLSSFQDDLECLLPDTTRFYRISQEHENIPIHPIIRSKCPTRDAVRRVLVQRLVAII